MFLQILIFLFPYFIGAIPTGFWFAKFFFNVDVTKHGSGNIGATNVARVLGSKKYFLLIFFLDFLKAFLCLILIKLVLSKTTTQDFLFIVSIFLLVGNAYSVFLKLKGGKGVATTLGILAFLFPWLFIIFLISWGLIIFATKRVDVASLLSIYFTTSVSFFFFQNIYNFYFLLFLSLWLTLRHNKNIKKIIA